MTGEKEYTKTIVVNTRLLIADKLEGIGRFSLEILSRLVKLKPNYHFIFLFDRPFDKQFIFAENVTPVVVGPQARHPILFIIWFEFSVKRFLKKLKPDLFISPDGYLSLSSNGKSISVIHDLNFIHYPDALPWIVKKYYNYFFPRFAKKASQIVTVSNFSKQDIQRSYDMLHSKIDVVYNGVSDCFHTISEEEKQKIRDAYTNGKEYFLFVGSLHPRKNLVTLIKAFNKFKNSDTQNIKLLIVGKKYWFNEEMKKMISESGNNNNIIFTGRVDDEELNRAYGAAIALAFIPLFEGFGFPVVEAMKAGTAVICSSTSSLPEVAGSAALKVNPLDIDEIANAMKRMANDIDLRKKFIAKGIEQAKKFNWDESAIQFSKIIDSTIDAKALLQ